MCRDKFVLGICRGMFDCKTLITRVYGGLDGYGYKTGTYFLG